MDDLDCRARRTADSAVLIWDGHPDITQHLSLAAKSVPLAFAAQVEDCSLIRVHGRESALDVLDPAAAAAGHASTVVIEVDTGRKRSVENGRTDRHRGFAPVICEGDTDALEPLVFDRGLLDGSVPLLRNRIERMGRCRLAQGAGRALGVFRARARVDRAVDHLSQEPAESSHGLADDGEAPSARLRAGGRLRCRLGRGAGHLGLCETLLDGPA